MLSDLRTWLNVLGCCYNAETIVEVNSRENHSLTLYAHHLSWGEVSNEQYAFADEFLRILVVLCYTRAYGAVHARSVVDGELKEFL